MAELIAPTGRVHWVGTGMSSGSGLGLVCAGTSTVLRGRTVQKAEDHLARLGLAGKAETRAFDAESLAREIAVGDVVVSMIPASEHSALVRLAMEHDAHFVCSSYESPAIRAFAGIAREKGLVLLTEVGLDPGIDHLLSRELVRKAKAATGERLAAVRYTSYCGSNPAVPNDFRYTFSWAPRGVLMALLTPARLIEEGITKNVERPWEAVTSQAIGGEMFEVYPNRDSVPFIGMYEFPSSWQVKTFVRGTLRLDGWSKAWQPVFTELVNGNEKRISELAEELAARYPATAEDRDRVVMSVKLDVQTNTGDSWAGEYALDVVGNEKESATPRLVSVPLACAILDVAAGRVAPGLHQSADDMAATARWLGFFSAHGISATFREDGAA